MGPHAKRRSVAGKAAAGLHRVGWGVGAVAEPLTVAVTGGTGFVGRHVVLALLERGARVALLKRPGRDGRRPGEVGRLLAQVLTAGGRVVEGDLADPGALAELVAGAGCVVHLVGIIRERPRQGQTFEAVVQRGSRAVVEAARAAGVGRFVLMSALGADPGSPLPYFRTKGLAEEAARQAGFRELFIFRPSIIYGPGDGFVSLLARILRWTPVFPIFGDGQSPLRPVAVQGVAQAFARACLDPPGGPGVRVYEVAGPQVLSYREVVQTIARVLGRRVHLVSVPLGLVWPLVRVGQHLPGFPITAQQLQMLLLGSTGDPTAFYRDFEVPPVAFQEGIAAWLA